MSAAERGFVLLRLWRAPYSEHGQAGALAVQFCWLKHVRPFALTLC